MLCSYGNLQRALEMLEFKINQLTLVKETNEQTTPNQKTNPVIFGCVTVFSSHLLH